MAALDTDARIVGNDDPLATRQRRTAHAAWDELLDTLVDFRVPVDDAETPRATAARVVHRLRLAAAVESSTQLLAQAEERARYARTPLAEADLSAPVLAVRKALKDQVSWRTRLGAALFPRSVLARWRATLNARSLRLSVVSGRVGEAVGSVLNPRRLFPGRSR